MNVRTQSVDQNHRWERYSIIAVVLSSVLLGIIIGYWEPSHNLFLFGISALVLFGIVWRVVVLGHPYIVLAVYGADLHKVLLNAVPLVLGNPRAWDNYTHITDYGIAVLGLLTFLLTLLRGESKWKRWLVSTPILAQLGLVYLKMMALLQTPNSQSLLALAQFIGGNTLLLMMTPIVCRKEIQIRRVWKIWVVTALILAVISIWLLTQGAVWKSAREKYLALASIRTGRASALALIYLFFATSENGLSVWKRWMRRLVLLLLTIPIISAGSKASFVGLIMVGGVYLVLLPKRRTKLVGMIGFVLILSVLLMPLFLDTSILPQFFNYRESIDSRMEISRYYFQKILSSPLLGSGISASYGSESTPRTHNILLELFVQVGILGPVLFLVFVASIVILGWQVIWKTASRTTQDLAMATLLACLFTIFMAQVTGDIVGNRDIWLFSGLLLSLYFQQRNMRG